MELRHWNWLVSALQAATTIMQVRVKLSVCCTCGRVCVETYPNKMTSNSVGIDSALSKAAFQGRVHCPVLFLITTLYQPLPPRPAPPRPTHLAHTGATHLDNGVQTVYRGTTRSR